MTKSTSHALSESAATTMELPSPAAEKTSPAIPFSKDISTPRQKGGKRPFLLKLRSSEIFITFVVGYGVFVDMFVVS